MVMEELRRSSGLREGRETHTTDLHVVCVDSLPWNRSRSPKYQTESVIRTISHSVTITNTPDAV